MIEKGWIEYYEPFYSPQDSIIPDVELNSQVNFTRIDSAENFSSPPNRFNESSLLKRMEEKQIGTKATRAGIIQTLFSRGYIEGSEIKPTPLGNAVVRVLQDHYPSLIQPKMTRDLELTMEMVQEKNIEISKVIMPIKENLKKSLLQFNNKESEIGLSLHKNLRLTEKTETVIIGKCDVCKKGNLRIIKSKKTGKRFIACSAYFDESIQCEASYPIPASGTISPTNQTCEHDGLPLVEWKKGNKRQLICISLECPSKQQEKKK